MSEDASRKDMCASIQSFVIFDTETTGLAKQCPKITELCFLGVSRRDLKQGPLVPRVINKLLIFADPCKDIEPEAAHITGLSCELLCEQKKFESDLTQLLSIFLNRLPKPVCLLAHNGNWFDFPLLVSELRQAEGCLPDDILCADTMQAFKNLDARHESDSNSAREEPTDDRSSRDGRADDNSSTRGKPADDSSSRNMAAGDFPTARVEDTARTTTSNASRRTKYSYRQIEVYKRIFGEEPSQCHTAEDDCLSLLKIVRSFAPEFLEWADQNAKPLRDVNPMY